MTTRAPVTTVEARTWLEAGERDVIQPGWEKALAGSASVDGVVLRPSALAAAVATAGRFERVIGTSP